LRAVAPEHEVDGAEAALLSTVYAVVQVASVSKALVFWLLT
jgi:hypothetical protein